VIRVVDVTLVHSEGDLAGETPPRIHCVLVERNWNQAEVRRV
jgi:hypothetical protein